MNCAFCPHHKCYTSGQNCTRLTHEEISEYYTDEDKKMMRASSATESRNYLKMTRLEESVFFAKEMGVKKVGIAFCIGLANEAHFCAQYFKNEGLDVQSVCCKVCSVDKDLLELEKIVSLAKSYPPRVRKVVADILGDIRQTVLQTEMVKTILPTTRFNLDYKTA